MTRILKDNNIGVVENFLTRHKNPYNRQNLLLMYLLLSYKSLRFVESKENALEKLSASLKK